MAFCIQTSIPELTDNTLNSKETLAEHGADQDIHSFANSCLLA